MSSENAIEMERLPKELREVICASAMELSLLSILQLCALLESQNWATVVQLEALSCCCGKTLFLPSIYQNAELEPILYECSKCCHHIENEDAAALLQNCRIFYWAHLAILQFSLSSPSVTVVELKANKFEVAAYFALKTLQILSSISSEVAHPSWINLFTPS